MNLHLHTLEVTIGKQSVMMCVGCSYRVEILGERFDRKGEDQGLLWPQKKSAGHASKVPRSYKCHSPPERQYIFKNIYFLTWEQYCW